MGFKSPIQEVERFLKELRGVIRSSGFDADQDFVLVQKYKPPDQLEFSTPYTLIELDYDADDVIKALDELTVSEYSETLFDQRNDQPPLLFVFGKIIQGKQVYIKVKVKHIKQAFVLCVSFHFAQYPMSHPYK